MGINSNGGLIRKSSNKLDSYPEFIDASSDYEYSSMALICGKAFNGISVVRGRAQGFSEDKISSGRIFSSARFFDLDYDGYADITAYNPIERAFVFYRNSRGGRFYEARMLRTREVHDFIFKDVNNDGFSEMISGERDGIRIYKGDVSSLFQESILIRTTWQAEKILSADLNNDGMDDLICFDKSRGKASVLFNKGNYEFHEYRIYTEKEFIDITISGSKGSFELILYSAEGELIKISRGKNINTDSEIFVPSRALALARSSVNNDSFPDISFIDSGSQTLNIYLSSPSNLFGNMFSVGISYPFPMMKYFKHEETNCFLLYSKSEKYFEFVAVESKNLKVSKQLLYVPDPIIYIDFYIGEQGDCEIAVVSKKKKSIKFTLFGKEKNKFIEKDQLEYSGNSDNIYITKSREPEVFILENLNTGFRLKTFFLLNKYGEKKEYLIKETSEKEETVTGLEYSDQTFPVTFFKAKNNYDIYFSGLIPGFTEAFSLVPANNQERIPITRKSHFLFKDDERDELKIFYFDFKRKRAFYDKLIESKGITDYFVTDFFGRNYLVYTKKNISGINIKILQ